MCTTVSAVAEVTTVSADVYKQLHVSHPNESVLQQAVDSQVHLITNDETFGATVDIPVNSPKVDSTTSEVPRAAVPVRKTQALYTANMSTVPQQSATADTLPTLSGSYAPSEIENCTEIDDSNKEEPKVIVDDKKGTKTLGNNVPVKVEKIDQYAEGQYSKCDVQIG